MEFVGTVKPFVKEFIGPTFDSFYYLEDFGFFLVSICHCVCGINRINKVAVQGMSMKLEF